MFYEPLFVFARSWTESPANPGEWADLRLAVGPEGSGTRAAATALMTASGVAPAEVILLPAGGADAVAELRSGTADLALFVAPLAAPYLQPLFSDPEMRLLRLSHLEAVARRMDDADVVTLHAGGCLSARYCRNARSTSWPWSRGSWRSGICIRPWSTGS
jgi:TRAP-type uncharacterized transport system substrate-binding protein